MPEQQLQSACPNDGGYPKYQTKQAGQEHERFQTEHVGSRELGQPAAPSLINEALASPGQALALATRAFFEPRFGYDFSRVRVHTDWPAVQSAGDVKARAYTVGQHVVFGAGEYAPGTNAGDSLIAHELVHTVQQGTDVVRPRNDAFTTRLQRTPAESVASKTETDTSPATRGSAFDPSCNRVQQEFIGLVLQKAKLMVDRAMVRMLFLWMHDSGGSDRDYLHWFGTFHKGRARYVLRTYQLISRALDRRIEFACDCDRPIYAHSFPGLKRKIHFCARFWSAPFSGLNSKPGVIVHELSHEVLRGGDFRYSIAKAERLAVNFPWFAVRNADNYEYFAESL